MESVDRVQLEQSLKDLALNGINMLIAHNVKGADLIKKGIESIIDVTDEFEAHYDQLKVILNVLKPIFDIVREWLVKAYQYFVELWDWAKAKWHEIFG